MSSTNIDSPQSSPHPYQTIFYDTPADWNSAGVFSSIPSEVIEKIGLYLREKGDTVLSMRYLSAWGSTCRYIGKSCFSPRVITPLLGSKSANNPTVPFETQRSLASYCANTLTKWVIHNYPPKRVYQEHPLLQTLSRLPNLQELVFSRLFEWGGERDIDELVKTMVDEQDLFPKLETIRIICHDNMYVIPFRNVEGNLRIDDIKTTADDQKIETTIRDLKNTGVLEIFAENKKFEDVKILTSQELPGHFTGVILNMLNRPDEQMSSLLKNWKGWAQAKEVTINVYSKDDAIPALIRSIRAPRARTLSCRLNRLTSAQHAALVQAIPTAFPHVKRFRFSSNRPIGGAGGKILFSSQGLNQLHTLSFASSSFPLSFLFQEKQNTQIREISLLCASLDQLVADRCIFKRLKVLHLKSNEEIESKDNAVPFGEPLWKKIHSIAPHVVYVALYFGHRASIPFPIIPPTVLRSLRVLDLSGHCFFRGQNEQAQSLRANAERFRLRNLEIYTPADPLPEEDESFTDSMSSEEGQDSTDSLSEEQDAMLSEAEELFYDFDF